MFPLIPQTEANVNTEKASYYIGHCYKSSVKQGSNYIYEALYFHRIGNWSNNLEEA